MLCQSCGLREAAIDLTSLVEGAVSREHLCEACFVAVEERSRGRPLTPEERCEIEKRLRPRSTRSADDKEAQD